MNVLKENQNVMKVTLVAVIIIPIDDQLNEEDMDIDDISM